MTGARDWTTLNVMNAKLLSFHYLGNGFDASLTVHASSVEHARVKLLALYDIPDFNPAKIVSHADFVAQRDAALEPMGIAPWQKRANRDERRNQFPLV